jgi:hypothetical protein
MSLLKARKLLGEVRDFSDIQEDFLDVLDNLGDTVTLEELYQAVALYGEYGVAYMVDVANSLEDPTFASDTMKFMNSYIAEFCKAANVHYFNKEFGYSIVDKVVQDALDNAGKTSIDKVAGFVAEIELSYVEPKEDTEEE